MALIDIQGLAAAIRQSRSRRTVDDRLRLIRSNIRDFEGRAKAAWRGRNIVLGKALDEKAAAWKQAERDYLRGIA